MSLAKKIFVISTILLAVVLFFWGAYYFVFRVDQEAPLGKKADIEDTEEENGDSNNDKNIGEDKLAVISEEAVISPAVDRNKEKIVYHLQKNGKVVKMNFDGSDEEFYSSAEIYGLKSAAWSAGTSKAILKVEKEGSYFFDVYDYAGNTDKEFKGGVDTLVWTNLGDKVIYKYFDSATGKRTINIANPDGTDWKAISEVNDRSLEIAQVPQSTDVSFWNSPNSFEKTNLRIASILDGESRTIFSEKYGADYLWSPTGNKVLISSSESKGSGKMNLGLANANGGEYQNLNIPTFVSKCVWSKNGKYIYYALPNSIPEGEVMPNSYLEKRITTNDTFWKMEVSTGKKERVLGLGEMKKNCDASDLFLSPNEKILYFVNQADGNKLYVIDL